MVDLNHIIVPSRDKEASAAFLAEVLGLEAKSQWGPFVPLDTGNGVTLYFMDVEAFHPIHCCFLVSESQFDSIMGRIKSQCLDYWAAPDHEKPGEINHLFGGRGVYFDDPNGHSMEVITQPYS